MLTPFDIKPRVEQIRKYRSTIRTYDEVARARVARDIFRLYRDVLVEIAHGSLDARSLAVAAMEVELPQHNR